MNLINLIKKFKRPYLFTTPSHSGSGFGEFAKLVGQKVFNYDFSEIDGFDNIRQPEGVLLESQKCSSSIYNSKNSFYLFNGSSSGILALLIATLNEGDKVLTTKNSHISVFNGLKLTKAEPVFIELDSNENFDVPQPICIEKFKQALNDDIKLAILTNPTYEGVITDIKPIASICKEQNIPLIIDESHGALWPFSSELPIPAIANGADASVHSLHKTAGALTQSSILHIAQNSLISPEKVQESLNMINSTSPSYLLLASAESAIGFLDSKKGQKELLTLLQNLKKTRQNLSAINKVELLPCDDPSKILLKIEGLSGKEISHKLSQHEIEDELCTNKAVMLLTGIGTSKSKLKKLESAIKSIAKK